MPDESPPDTSIQDRETISVEMFREMARELQQLRDIEQIKRLRAAYFRCLDTANIEELGTLLTDDFACLCLGGDYEYKAEGKAAFLAMTEDSFHREIVTQHNGHGPEIDLVDDSHATGIVYFHDQVYHFRSREMLMGTGIYHDRYRKEDGRWKIEYGKYERVYELTEMLPRAPHFTAHWLGKHGKQLPETATYDPQTGRYV